MRIAAVPSRVFAMFQSQFRCAGVQPAAAKHAADPHTDHFSRNRMIARIDYMQAMFPQRHPLRATHADPYACKVRCDGQFPFEPQAWPYDTALPEGLPRLPERPGPVFIDDRAVKDRPLLPPGAAGNPGSPIPQQQMVGRYLDVFV